MFNLEKFMPKFKFLSYVAKFDPAFARSLEIGIYMLLTYVVLGFIQGSFNFDLQTLGAILFAPALALVAKRKRDLEIELNKFKEELSKESKDLIK